MTPKPLLWLGDSIERVRGFADHARRRVGFELWQVQRGAEPSDSKSLPQVGLGVKEIRVHIDGAHLARNRFRDLVRERRQP